MSNSYSDSINSRYSQFRLTINSHEHRLAGCISNSIISGANIQSFIAFSTHGERAIYDHRLKKGVSVSVFGTVI